MKVLVVSPTDLSSGRGAENALAGVLPTLATRASVRVVSLGRSGAEFTDLAASCGVDVTEVGFRTRGWFVLNAATIARQVVDLARDWHADLVVLYWEIWDLVREFARQCPRAGVSFTVVLHAIPFAYAPPRPSSFHRDAVRRVIGDRDLTAIAYTLRRLPRAKRLLEQVPTISANATVSHYLRGYFPRLRFIEALPGAAVETPAASTRVPEYDCVFMAKLIPGKGIFLLPRILAAVVRRRPAARLLVIGTFERVADERRFRRLLSRHGVADRVDLVGWARGVHKYELLASGRVFVYPSFAADTFAIALLEALACGVPAVTYDVPFARASYATPAVRLVPLGDDDAFAGAVLDVVQSPDRSAIRHQARAFAARHASWSDVGEAQLAAFRRVVG